MSESTHSSTSTCPVAQLAREASAIITGLDSCSLSEVERLFEIERAASEHLAQSPTGALFQLGVVCAHVDAIFSHVPSDSAALPYCEGIFREVQKMLHSVACLHWSANAEGAVTMHYFGCPDSFAH